MLLQSWPEEFEILPFVRDQFYMEVARNQQFTLIEIALESFLPPAPPKQC